MSKMITIGIPTYNRERQLRHQLKSIFEQDLTCVQEVLIIDNDSNYDINKLINEFDNEKIRLLRHPFNIKMATNMEMPFLFCKTKWLWLLSDDDEVLSNSIETIIQEISSCSPQTGMIKFSIDKPMSIQKNHEVITLEEFIDFYYEEKPIRRGDLVYLGTNIYNLDLLNQYLGSAFEFSYTYLGFLIPIIFGLDNRKISVKFSSKPLVRYLSPDDGGYSFGIVGKGMSSLSHVPLNVSETYRKKFLDITMSITYKALVARLLSKRQTINIDDFKIIYNNIYQYYIPWSDRIRIKLLFILMNFKVTKNLLYKLYAIRRENR